MLGGATRKTANLMAAILALVAFGLWFLAPWWFAAPASLLLIALAIVLYVSGHGPRVRS